MLHGYVRTNETEETADAQEAELRALSCDTINFDEGVKVGTFIKPMLKAMMNQAATGDTLVFSSMCRVSQYERDIAEFFSTCQRLGFDVVMIREELDTRKDPAIFKAMAALVSFGVALRGERRAAMAPVAANPLGRPQAIGPEKWDEIKSMMRGGVSISKISRDLKISRPTIYRMRDIEKTAEAIRARESDPQIDLETLIAAAV